MDSIDHSSTDGAEDKPKEATAIDNKTSPKMEPEKMQAMLDRQREFYRQALERTVRIKSYPIFPPSSPFTE